MLAFSCNHFKHLQTLMVCLSKPVRTGRFLFFFLAGEKVHKTKGTCLRAAFQTEYYLPWRCENPFCYIYQFHSRKRSKCEFIQQNQKSLLGFCCPNWHKTKTASYGFMLAGPGFLLYMKMFYRRFGVLRQHRVRKSRLKLTVHNCEVKKNPKQQQKNTRKNDAEPLLL